MSASKWFGGKGVGQPVGDAANDPIGTVRLAPDGDWLAIMWPSRPHPHTWAVTDYHGAAGYEKPERIAHWPIVGSVPCSPAAGLPLKSHKEERVKRAKRRSVVTVGLPSDEDRLEIAREVQEDRTRDASGRE